MNTTESRTPVTIITGFLGAGKTTLLNQIIEQNKSTIRLAIIENEVGDINIDADLIVGADDDIFQITDGCLCCTLNLELAKLLAALIKRKDEYDHLIIETTGVANPAGVAAVFVSDLDVQQHFVLDGVIGLVDTLYIEELIDNKETEAAQQLSFSDVLVFNKTDLVTPEQLQHVKQIIRTINPFAKQYEASFGELDTHPLLNIKAFEQPKLNLSFVAPKLPKGLNHHHGNITAQSFIFDVPFDFLKFKHFIEVLLIFQGMRIYRIKGILNIAGQNHKVVVQSVQKQVVYTKMDNWAVGEKRQSQLVVIGNGLKKEAFYKRLKTCLAKV